MIKKHGGNIYKFSRDNEVNTDEIIDFSANINPLGLSDKIDINFKNKLTEIINYPDPDYYELKKAISNYEQISDDKIILGNGAIECIFLLAEYLKSKHVLLLAPTFVEYERAFSKYNSKITYYNLDENNDFHLDINKMIMSISDDIDTILICNPNNPIGAVVSKSDMYLLLQYCNKNDIRLVVDEAFVDFFIEEDKYSLKEYLDENHNLTIIKSLTKFFAIPGLRLGYLLTSNKILFDRINNDRIPWTINSIAATIATEVLDDKEYIKRTKEYVTLQREYLKNEINKISGIDVISGEVNYIFIKSEYELKSMLLNLNIMIRDCLNYRNLNSKYFRIAVKDEVSNKKLIYSLKMLLEQE